MTQTYKIATLNINRIISDVKFQCLRDYLYAADIDVALIQEVVTTKISGVFGYDAILNIGSEGGTAVLFKSNVQMFVKYMGLNYGVISP